MKFLKLIRNNFALLFLAALAVSGIAFLVWAAGANVNCIGGTCNSTNGNTSIGGGSTADVFTNDNDTASIECAGGTYSGGGGNDTFYLRDPATPAAVIINGEDGDDVILDGCTTNNNFLNGVNGNDFIVGGSGNTRLNGDNGNDLLAGGQGNDVLGDSNGNGSCDINEFDPGNDVFVGGPGDDRYCTDAGDGDDIVIIHAGDKPAIGTLDDYICFGNDTILKFGYEQDGVTVLTAGQSVDEIDPLTGGTYTIAAGANSTCTIIYVE